MPLAPPPATARVSPNPLTLAAGTSLWRVHRKHRPSEEFKTRESDPHFGGGQFDAIAGDPYPYLYASLAPETALLETLVRSVPFELTTVAELTLINLLTTVNLAAACQDEWLVQAEPAQYPQTRRWGQWLRVNTSWAQGFIWPSRRNLGERTLVLFGDRCAEGALRPVQGAAVDLDDAEGAAWLNQRLALYRIRVKLPRCS